MKAALLLALAGLAAACLPRAAARSLAWTLGVVGALLLPLLALVPVHAPAGSWLAAPATLIPHGLDDAARALPLRGLWALGAALVAARFARSHLAAARLVRGARPDGFVEDVPLLRSAAIASPMTIGILHPRILLPVDAAATPAALLHELGHVRRRDALVQLLAQVACALYWFDPLAWYAARRLRIEREHACDDLVLDAGIAPSSYALELLAAGGHAGAICLGGATEARLRRLLDATVPRRSLRVRARLGATALALAATSLLACGDRLGVSAGAPSLRTGGAIDLERVAAALDHRLAELSACYGARALTGTIVLHASITTAGEVADTCVTEDTLNDPEVTDCVDKVITATRFPAPPAAVDVSFPFVFGG